MTEHSWLLKDLLRRWGGPPPHRYPAAYPHELRDELRTSDGRRLRIRPVRPDDAPRLRAAFARLSPETIYRRFHGHLRQLSDADYRYLTHLDYEHHLALLALDEQGEAVAVARYYAPEGEELGEAAIVVEDAWQGHGVGSHLLKDLVRAAEVRGLTGFQAFVQPDNQPVGRMIERAGFRVHVEERDPDTLRVWFSFADLI